MRSWPSLAAAVLLASCGKEEEEPPACPPDSELTWASFGDPFLRSWCTGCHSSALAAEDRQSAPVGVDFDTLDGVRAHLQAVRRRTVVDADMPPAGGPDTAAREQLAEWLACGAPGVDAPGHEDTDALPTVPEPEGCGRVGHWILSGATCGGADVTDQWTAMFPLTELVVTEWYGTCAIEYHLADAGCDERQEWRSDLTSPSADFQFLGTVACEPVACSWSAFPEDVCQVLETPVVQPVVVTELPSGGLGLGPLAPPDLAGFCDALGLVFVPVDG